MIETDFFTIDEEKTSKIEIKRSRFLGFAKSIKTDIEAKEFIDSLRKKFFDARHVCYAYILSDGTIKSSDDGEPTGTAGVPILDAIKSTNLKDIIVVVVRYFGGVLLGASNLYRAYADSAKETLKDIKICKMVQVFVKNVDLSYDNYARFENFAIKNNIVILDKVFDENAKLKIGVPSQDNDKIIKNAPIEFRELLNSKIIEELYVKVKD